MNYDPISRSDAAALGRKRFYTGKPCKYGHDSQRFVTTGGCVACNADRSRLFSKAVAMSGSVNFTYPLHPGDMAAALNYCQALDMQRGRVPYRPPSADTIYEKRGNRFVPLSTARAEPTQAPQLPGTPVSLDMEAMRALAYEKALALAGPSPDRYIPAP